MKKGRQPGGKKRDVGKRGKAHKAFD